MNVITQIADTMKFIEEHGRGRKYPLAGSSGGLWAGIGISKVLTIGGMISEKMGHYATWGRIGAFILQCGLERTMQDYIAQTQWPQKKEQFSLVCFGILTSAAIYTMISSGLNSAEAIAFGAGLGAAASSIFSKQPCMRAFSAFSGFVSAGAQLFTKNSIGFFPIVITVMYSGLKSLNFAVLEEENKFSDHIAEVAPLALCSILGSLSLQGVNIKLRIQMLKWKLEEVERIKANPTVEWEWSNDIKVILEILPELEKLLCAFQPQDSYALNLFLESEVFQCLLFLVTELLDENQSNPHDDWNYILQKMSINNVILELKKNKEALLLDNFTEGSQMELIKINKLISMIERLDNLNLSEVCKDQVFQRFVRHMAFDLRAYDAVREMI